MLQRTRIIEYRLNDERLRQVRFIYCRTMDLSEEEAWKLCEKTFNQINAYMDLQAQHIDISELKEVNDGN